MTVASSFKSAGTITDPYQLLNRLQDTDPVHWSEDLGAWCVTRYRDVEEGLKDARFSSDRIRPFVAAQNRAGREHLKVLGDALSLWMVFNDPPMHTRLRGLVNQAFSRRAVEALRPKIATIVHDLVDQVRDRPTFDLIRDIAYPLPATVIADMLGVPREDVEDLKRWSDDVATFVLASRNNPERYAIAAGSLAEMLGYFERLVAIRRRQPGEDIIDLLIAAHEGEDHLTLEELISSCVLLLFAGHETTTHFIANGMLALARHPEQAELLKRHAGDANLLRNALNEMLRWEGPSISQLRIASEDIAFGGKSIPKGNRVYLFIAGANRDPRVFENPGRFDIARHNAARQLAFGSGIHLCLGAHLARLEGEIAFPILTERLGRFELKDPVPDWTDSLVIRSMHRMPIATPIPS